MSEAEKFEQVGRLAEEYSKLRGEFNHVVEKLTRCQQSYQQLGNLNLFNSLRITNGALMAPLPPTNQMKVIEGMLNADELKHFIVERERLNKELAELKTRISALAPHLL